MNRKQIIIALAVMVILGITSLFIMKSKKSDWHESHEGERSKVFQDLDVNKVMKITISDSENTVTIAKKGDTWKVVEKNDYPANFKNVVGSLMRLRNLKIAQNIKVGASQLGRLKLKTDGEKDEKGIKVELFDSKNQKISSMLLGKTHESKNEQQAPNPFGPRSMPDGRYFMSMDGKNQVMLVSDHLNDFSIDFGKWLDMTFIKFNDLKSITLKNSKNEILWTLSKKDKSANFALDDLKKGEKADESAIKSLSSAFSYFAFDDVARGDKKLKDFGLKQPYTMIIESFNGFKYTMKISQQGDMAFLKLTVSANFPKQRTALKDEKPEDKERLDKEFKDKLIKLEEQLAEEKCFESWIYKFGKQKYKTLTKDRQSFIKKEKPAPKAQLAPKNNAKLQEMIKSKTGPRKLKPSPKSSEKSKKNDKKPEMTSGATKKTK